VKVGGPQSLSGYDGKEKNILPLGSGVPRNFVREGGGGGPDSLFGIKKKKKNILPPGGGDPQEFLGGGGGGNSINSVEDRGQRERGSGGGSPLVRGSGGS